MLLLIHLIFVYSSIKVLGVGVQIGSYYMVAEHTIIIKQVFIPTNV